MCSGGVGDVRGGGGDVAGQGMGTWPVRAWCQSQLEGVSASHTGPEWPSCRGARGRRL